MTDLAPDPPAEWVEELKRFQQWYIGEERRKFAHVRMPLNPNRQVECCRQLWQIAKAESTDANRLSVTYMTGEEPRSPALRSFCDDSKIHLARHSDREKLNLDQRNGLIIIDADESLSLPYVLSILTIAALERSDPNGNMRFVWTSSLAVEPSLNKMLSVFGTQQLTEVEAFLMPDVTGDRGLGDLDWRTYPGDCLQFYHKAAERIALDFGMDQTGKQYRRTTVVVYWDPSDPKTPVNTLVNRLHQLAGKAFNVYDEQAIGETARGVVIRAARSLDTDAHFIDFSRVNHIVVPNEAIRRTFDHKMARIVRHATDASPAGTMAQIQNALLAAAGVTVHAQVTLEEFSDIKLRREFEHVHMLSFIATALVNFPEVSLLRLGNAYVEDMTIFEDAVTQLDSLGLISQNPDISPLRHEPSAELGVIKEYLSVACDNFSVASFLAHVTPETSPVLRFAIVEIAAIVLCFLSDSAYRDMIQFDISFDPTDASHVRDLLDSCDGIPDESVTLGAVWASLGLYRRHKEMVFDLEHEAVVDAAEGRVTVDLDRIEDALGHEVQIMECMEKVTESPLKESDDLRLTSGDIEKLLVCMTTAWAHELFWSRPGKRAISVGNNAPVSMARGWYRQLFSNDDPVLVIGFQTSQGSSKWPFLRIATPVPTVLARAAFEAAGIDWESLEATRPTWKGFVG
ncbi:hypothetical protein K4K54_010537 [Colletotrichum sp. SAR 10_86]|nr:hypothetical protein KHU50_010094 [Colletotrichum sp. SAR 10_65]KAI8173087.1 hypothetical protein K4K51_010335 [Colletotrichum sp. SAR 10_75]KAI8218361.1 hypothetical protein K4K54_010537 [Colletotrichum sp. SAR 10_86]